MCSTSFVKLKSHETLLSSGTTASALSSSPFGRCKMHFLWTSLPLHIDFLFKKFFIKVDFSAECMCLLQRIGKLVEADFYEKLFMLGIDSKPRRG